MSLDIAAMIPAASAPVTDAMRKEATFTLNGQEFCPYDHFTEIRDQTGQVKEYLPYAARLAWFRAKHPKGVLKTEIIEHDRAEGYILIKATVDDADGGYAEAYGSCTKASFSRGYVEKAETKAKNRALADLGYGTLFAQELAEDEDENNLADTPQARRQNTARQQTGRQANNQERPAATGQPPATQERPTSGDQSAANTPPSPTGRQATSNTSRSNTRRQETKAETPTIKELKSQLQASQIIANDGAYMDWKGLLAIAYAKEIAEGKYQLDMLVNAPEMSEAGRKYLQGLIAELKAKMF